MKTSILQDVINDIYTAPDVESAKKIAVKCIKDGKISTASKARMLTNIAGIDDLERLQFYLTNSTFAKLGMRAELPTEIEKRESAAK